MDRIGLCRDFQEVYKSDWIGFGEMTMTPFKSVIIPEQSMLFVSNYDL